MIRAPIPATCDVQGCTGTTRRPQRLCGDCYRRLPGEFAVALTAAHDERRFADWARLRRQCAEHLGIPAPAPSTTPARAARRPVHPTAAYAATARLLGERE